MLVLYPNIKPYAQHNIIVSKTHTLYVEECGNPDGIPVVFLHGGPGLGCDQDHRRYFDPSLYRIILFDQRGCGRSTPHGELRENNTQLLVSDMESIRQHLGIDKWVLFGGSWGATLALVYAEMHSEFVMHMILRGIFLLRDEDISWFYQHGGASRIFPDAWQEFLHILPQAEQHDILGNYYKRLTGPDELARMAAAKAWSAWEANCATLQPNHNLLSSFTNPHTAFSLARIEAHYFVNNGFLKPNQILDDAHNLADVPGIIIHGRYDMICPLDNAYLLHKAWPNAELQIVRDAGHAACESGLVNALINATMAVAKKYN